LNHLPPIKLDTGSFKCYADVGYYLCEILAHGEPIGSEGENDDIFEQFQDGLPSKLGVKDSVGVSHVTPGYCGEGIFMGNLLPSNVVETVLDSIIQIKKSLQNWPDIREEVLCRFLGQIGFYLDQDNRLVFDRTWIALGAVLGDDLQRHFLDYQALRDPVDTDRRYLDFSQWVRSSELGESVLEQGASSFENWQEYVSHISELDLFVGDLLNGLDLDTIEVDLRDEELQDDVDLLDYIRRSIIQGETDFCVLETFLNALESTVLNENDINEMRDQLVKVPERKHNTVLRQVDQMFLQLIKIANDLQKQRLRGEALDVGPEEILPSLGFTSSRDGNGNNFINGVVFDPNVFARLLFFGAHGVNRLAEKDLDSTSGIQTVDCMTNLWENLKQLIFDLNDQRS
jgi:hypothetical protein